MALLEVLHFPDDRLRTVAKPVEEITPEIKQFAADMIETMYDEDGVGLAATQVNVHQRIVVIDVSAERNQPLVLINPTILESDGVEISEEGCLSVPETNAEVQRAEFVTLEYQDLDGETQVVKADGLFAVCIQHELDHLKGKLFIDYLSPFKQKRVKAKLEKLKRQQKKFS
ncbi:peptide deformylase [Psychromonas sp. 14N.309.X.WAT.B.A12]|uniref:peptide deformylase n=1 Tax=unclassified Psychromonas TaxID=2614957 RepID=UPI0025B061D3|nr:peptide deformylase [Psychromonas sp. 14N.309.X.WAT.B.A12]MDN2664784.1 peptide deformylase [Psychromonas sp. 14N.309.X.WAT.B.A12]